MLTASLLWCAALCLVCAAFVPKKKLDPNVECPERPADAVAFNEWMESTASKRFKDCIKDTETRNEKIDRQNKKDLEKSKTVEREFGQGAPILEKLESCKEAEDKFVAKHNGTSNESIKQNVEDEDKNEAFCAEYLALAKCINSSTLSKAEQDQVLAKPHEKGWAECGSSITSLAIATVLTCALAYLSVLLRD